MEDRRFSWGESREQKNVHRGNDMRTHDNNTLRMFKTVIAVLGKNSAIWSVIPKLVTAIAKFTASVGKIDSFEQSLTGGTKGVTLDKRNARTKMVESAIEVAG